MSFVPSMAPIIVVMQMMRRRQEEEEERSRDERPAAPELTWDQRMEIYRWEEEYKLKQTAQALDARKWKELRRL